MLGKRCEIESSKHFNYCDCSMLSKVNMGIAHTQIDAGAVLELFGRTKTVKTNRNGTKQPHLPKIYSCHDFLAWVLISLWGLVEFFRDLGNWGDDNKNARSF